MENPRSDKVAVVDEVRERLGESSASVVTEYRGLTVAAMAELRRTLRASGGDFKVFKNTLVRRAIEGGDHAGLADHLVGPTAITFVSGDVSAVAKALKDFAKTNPALIIKGGVLDGKSLSDKDLKALADLPSRDVLLSQLAGLIASPMQQLASLFKAVPQSLAYGLKALIETMPSEAVAPVAEVEAAPAEDESPAEAADEAAPAEDETPAEAADEAAPAEDETPVEAADEAAPAEDETPVEADDEAPAPESDVDA